MEARHASQVIVPGVEVLGPLDARALVLEVLQLRHDGGGDAVGDLVLYVEDVLQLAVEALGPDVVVGVGVDELRRDPQAVAGLSHAAFQDVAGPQLPGDLADPGVLVFEREAGVAGHHGKRAPVRQSGDDVLGQAVGEVLLLGVAAHVLERQDSDRRPRQELRLGVGRRGRAAAGIGGRLFAQQNAIDPHRLADVLNRLRAHVGELDLDLAGHVIEHGAGHADAAGRGQDLQARGDVDAVAVDVGALDDDVAQVDADAQPDTPLVRQLGLARRHGALNLDGAVHRLDDARELGQQAVAHELDDAALALRDLGLHQLLAERLQALQRPGLVLAHEAGIADHVGGEYGGESTFQARSPSPVRLPATRRRIYAAPQRAPGGVSPQSLRTRSSRKAA